MNPKRLLFEVHRWLGVVLALFMLMWFVSGLVIVYAPATAQTRAQQLAHAELLAPESGWLSLGEAWEKSASQRQAAQATAGKKPLGEANVADARLARVAGEPLWLVEDTRGGRIALSARDGGVRDVSAGQALHIAGVWLDEPAEYLRHVETFERDATVRNFENWAPFHRVADPETGVELVISARTGEVLRVTDRVDRALFWAGNWLHMLRPLDALGWGEARRDVLLWISGFTLVATLTGLIVGWLRWRPGWFGKPTYAEGRVHPYRAFWFRWHFWAGLLGGIVALTWIASGFLVNNPWQVFSAANPSREELARYQGKGLPDAMRNWRPADLGEDRTRIVELNWRRLGDEAVLLASGRDGQRWPLSAAAGHFSEGALLAAAQRLSPAAPVPQPTLQTEYDGYYYPRHNRGAGDRPLPVLRVDLADAGATRLYLDPQDGRLLLRQDESRRAFRWLFSALHHWDFGWLYARPLWDGWMLLWIAFGLVLSASSLVIGWRRLRSTFSRKPKDGREVAPALAVDAAES